MKNPAAGRDRQKPRDLVAIASRVWDCRDRGTSSPVTLENDPNLERYAGLPPEDAEQRRREYRELFGHEAPDWEEEANAPPISDELVEHYRKRVNGLLSAEESVRLDVLAARFRSIAAVRDKIWREEAGKRN